jgi:hypothetical protein
MANVMQRKRRPHAGFLGDIRERVGVSGNEESDRLPVTLRAAFSLEPGHQPT